MDLVRLFDKVVEPQPEDDTMTSITYEEEEHFWCRLLKPASGSEEYLAISEEVHAYHDNVIRPRARRITRYLKKISKLPRTLVIPNTAGHAALQRAYKRFCVEGADESDMLRLALMDLAVANWNSPYPYMTMAKLRDAWFKGWIDTTEVKAIILMFLMEGSSYVEEAPGSPMKTPRTPATARGGSLRGPRQPVTLAERFPNYNSLMEESDFRMLFDTYERDDEGTISRDAFKADYKQLESFGVTPSDKEVEHLFSRYDTNGDGRLSFNEFVLLMLNRFRH
jgi:hypothetical protein